MQANPSTQRSDPLVGQTLPGGLRVVERLGGADDEPLYRGQYRQTGPPVALQFLRNPRNALDPSASLPPPTRLWQQLRRACQIRHPNVASLLELSRTPDGVVFAVSEMLSGQLLSEVLSARRTLPLAEVVDIGLQAAAGLQAAHQLGVAHGRLSPATILLTSAEDDRVLVKLIGFDFSWYGVDPEQSSAPSAADQYSSPELLAGSAPDEVSDVYSLGAVLHHLLVGTAPGEKADRSSMPPPVRRVIDRALAPADQRYRSVAALAEALTQGAAASPSQQNPAARWRSGWLAASIATLLMAAPLAWGWDRIRPDLDRIPDLLKTGTDALKPASVSPSKGSSAKPRPEVERRKQPVETGLIPRSKATDSVAKPPPTPERRDTVRAPYISPFRRAHPWAAHPNGKAYFPSSCPLALASTELIYFRTEREARAAGRSRSTVPGCK
jgi:eukaryotic-like serine/threonine-protein kinase